MRYNKVEYSTASGLYCTTHDVEVNLCMPDFSISKIIEHCFHVYNNKVKSGIYYEIIIGRDLMVQLGLMSNLKRQFPQWGGATVPLK